MKRSLVFVSGGIGDALTLVPLLKRLRAAGRRISGVFSAPVLIELFEGQELFDDTTVVSGKGEAMGFSAKRFLRYDDAYIHFLGGRSHFPVALCCARNIVMNTAAEECAGKRFLRVVGMFPHAKAVALRPGRHAALQALGLLEGEPAEALDESAIALERTQRLCALGEKWGEDLGRDYVTVQISAGNSEECYKNWPAEHWREWLEKSAAEMAPVNFVLLGHGAEKEMASKILEKPIPGVCSLVGQTRIADALAIAAGAKVHVGVEGGLMHVAAAFGVPTFTIWGPSDSAMYGYAQMDGEKHEEIHKPVDCRPCESALAPNRSRVNHPSECPDRKCLTGLRADEVLVKSSAFLDRWCRR